MKTLIDSINYADEISVSTYLKTIKKKYDDNVIFHCFWNGSLNEKHLISIRSCYYFNVANRKNRKIILWLENNQVNEINEKIREYAEIRDFP